jgi:hypothetical protein
MGLITRSCGYKEKKGVREKRRHVLRETRVQKGL